MKIVFYTSDNPGINNLLNISNLIHSFPNHQYYFLVVEKSRRRLTFRQRLLNLYAHVKYQDGRFEFEKDVREIQQKLKQHQRRIDLTAFPHHYVSEVNDKASEEYLRKIDPDVVVQAGAGILKENIFTIPRGGTINVHHGVAPEVRGIYSGYWALYYGLHNLIGVTCHFIDRHLDTGPVLSQKKMKYSEGDSFVKVQCELGLLGAAALIEGLQKIGKDTKLIETEIDSYYFSSPSSFDYFKLKSNEFKPLGDITQVKSKKLFKKILV